MDLLRKSYIGFFAIKLTPEESRNGKEKMVQNPSWLIEDREFQSQHPHFRGPFDWTNARNYHIYCSLERWKQMRFDADVHWSRGVDCSFPINSHNYMLLPIQQRSQDLIYYITTEIFDDLMPEYVVWPDNYDDFYTESDDYYTESDDD